MNPCAKLLLVAALFSASAAASADGVYRWTDANGQVNYGQEPPANARGVRAVATDSAPVLPSNRSAEEAQLQDMADARHAREEQDAKAAKAEQKKRQQELARARAQQQEQHRADCLAGVLDVSACSDVNVAYYPVVRYRNNIQIAQPAQPPAPPAVVHPSVVTSAPKPASRAAVN